MDHRQREGHHLVLGAEVVLHHPGGDAGLGRHVPQADRFQPVLGGHPHQRVGDQFAALPMVDPFRHALMLSQYDCIDILRLAGYVATAM
ncbi:hypothetical protein [Micromonospora sp. ATA51]|uniref:hypothetical protein n=1 Tax=Micromonospora sp. ATA51 TaxID=2806098 RepID=UPI001EE3DCC9|nr:hypothetical protein [Micromonospora sp. ATA51]